MNSLPKLVPADTHTSLPSGTPALSTGGVTLTCKVKIGCLVWLTPGPTEAQPSVTDIIANSNFSVANGAPDELLISSGAPPTAQELFAGMCTALVAFSSYFSLLGI